MDFYIAARFRLKDEVREIHKRLREKGHGVVYDWTEEELIRPYEKNPEMVRETAEKSIHASESCDVFVLISDSAGTDMYGELCSAITSKKPKIYVIGDFLDRSKFFFHPRVKRMKSIDDIFQDLELTQ